MKKIILSIALAGAMLLSGCANQSKIKSNVLYGGYTNVASVDNAGKFPTQRHNSMAYHDHAKLTADKKKELANKMAGKKEIQRELRKIPKGGRGIVTIHSTTISGANTEWFEYVLYEKGKEIYRQKGEHSIAETPGYDRLWWNIDHVNFPKPITRQMTLYVIDNLTQARYKYVITKHTPISSKK